MATVLIIEDEQELANVLKAYLERGGYAVLSATRGDRGLSLWEEHHPDMVLLDLNLPGMDGIDIARQIRQTDDTPLIMVTARVDEVDRLVGLELGADDYITKPFSPREVVARVKAVLRRVEKQPAEESPAVLNVADLEIDSQAFTVTQSGSTLDLTPTEFSILATMAEHPGWVFSRLQLLEACQGMAYEGYERSIDAHIKNLRGKLGDDSKDPKYIETVFGKGYRMKQVNK
ncbi:MAG: response regulator transcription factor [Chloroflexota bacterium]|nr:response regulator transcription factor [Chloroflexota bacterium]